MTSDKRVCRVCQHTSASSLISAGRRGCSASVSFQNLLIWRCFSAGVKHWKGCSKQGGRRTDMARFKMEIDHLMVISHFGDDVSLKHNKPNPVIPDFTWFMRMTFKGCTARCTVFFVPSGTAATRHFGGFSFLEMKEISK